MKNLLFFSIISFAIVITSCKKFNDNELTNVSEEQTTQPNSNAPVGWGLNNTYCSECRSCDTPASNCFDEIVVKPSSKNFIGGFIDVANGRNDNNIISFVKQNFEELSDYISDDYLQKCLNGVLKLSAEYNKKTGIYFIIFSAKYKIEVVYQFVVQ